MDRKEAAAEEKVGSEELYISSRDEEEGVMMTSGGQGRAKQRVMLMWNRDRKQLRKGGSHVKSVAQRWRGMQRLMNEVVISQMRVRVQKEFSNTQ